VLTGKQPQVETAEPLCYCVQHLLGWKVCVPEGCSERVFQVGREGREASTHIMCNLEQDLFPF
jgi:hypothetical protein